MRKMVNILHFKKSLVRVLFAFTISFGYLNCYTFSEQDYSLIEQDKFDVVNYSEKIDGNNNEAGKSLFLKYFVKKYSVDQNCDYKKHKFIILNYNFKLKCQLKNSKNFPKEKPYRILIRNSISSNTDVEDYS
jgi:hypothetical protein